MRPRVSLAGGLLALWDQVRPRRLSSFPPTGVDRALARHGPRAPKAILVFVLVDFLVLGVTASLRHLNGQSAFFDLGVMANILWQTIHGRLFFYPQYQMSYFGDHFAPILFLFVPMYAIWADPLVLVLGQALALALGGLFVHRIALRSLIGDGTEGVLEAGPARRAAWIFTVLYALHPSVLHVAMFDFHPVTLMIPLSLGAYHCYLTRRWFWLWVSLALLAACNEEAAITVSAFGLSVLVFGRTRGERWVGITVSVMAALYFVLVMKLIIPAFQPNAGLVGWAYLSRYAHLGGSMSDVVRALALHPVDALVRSFELYKLETLGWLLLPLGLLPLLGWRALLVALPSLGYTYLSTRPTQFVIQHQYFSPALGWLVVGAIQGLSLWTELWKRRVARPPTGGWPTTLGLPLLVALVATIAIDAHLSPIKPRFFKGQPYRAELETLHRIIGPEASLSVTNRLAPSFANRREYVLALDFTLNRELVAALGLPDYRDTDFHLFDLTNLGGSQDRERRVVRLLGDARYSVRYYRFPLVLFERGLAQRPPPELEALVAGDGGTGPGVVRLFPAVFLNIDDARSIERDLGANGHDAMLRFVAGRRGQVSGPGVMLPVGSYRVDFHLMLDAPPSPGPVADLDVVSGPPWRLYAHRELTAADFGAARRCQPFTLPVELPAETAGLEFKTRSHGAGFALCKVVVRSASAGADPR